MCIRKRSGIARASWRSFRGFRPVTLESQVEELDAAQARPGLLARIEGLGKGIADTDLSAMVDFHLYGQEPQV